ncbi:HTTM domain-containing protein [Verrucomicrobium spinosum]|uniref:HTTM domain-containing protein n=1 Tax=Verrucomicrobium spinosum TaxID=2736 RepID=UPI00017450D2|nr:HTTM domain-containing protein [Verrucomicrobium spinosum]
MQNSSARLFDPVETGERARGWRVGLVFLRKIARGLGEAFALDLRSLALFRISLGLLILVDVGIAITNVEAFYSDEGVLPRQVLQERLWESSAQWSLHALQGGVGFEKLLLTAQLLAGVGLVAGWRTRWMNFLCWVLACSLETRNPLVSNGADAVMRLLLFWSLFLPLGGWWSCEASRRKRQGGDAMPVRWVSFPAVCWVMQVGFVYVFSAVMKDRGAWYLEGTALQTALHLDLFALPAGVWLREHAELCRWLTRGTVWLELVGPFLLLLTGRWPALRGVLCLAFILFHLGIGLCMNIGAFPWMMITAWLALLPGSWWDRFGTGTRGNTKGALPTARRTHPAAVVFTFVCLAYVFLWNLRGTDFSRWEKFFPRSVNRAAFALRLDQHWSMFAPFPTREDGWFVLRAGLSDGTEVDLLRSGEVTDWSKPPGLSSTFKDARWQKYLMNLWLQRYHEFRPAYGDWLVRHWNEDHGGLSQVVAWQLYFIHEPTLEGGKTGPLQRVLLAQCEHVPAGGSVSVPSSSSTSGQPSSLSP